MNNDFVKTTKEYFKTTFATPQFPTPSNYSNFTRTSYDPALRKQSSQFITPDAGLRELPSHSLSQGGPAFLDRYDANEENELLSQIPKCLHHEDEDKDAISLPEECKSHTETECIDEGLGVFTDDQLGSLTADAFVNLVTKVNLAILKKRAARNTRTGL